MVFFYICSIIPLLIGGFFWIRNKNVNWMEWVGGFLISLLVAGILQFAAISGQTFDVETWSGKIVNAAHYPTWVEEYQQMHTRQVASGRDSQGNTTYRTEVYYTTEYRTHHEHWTAYSNINTSYEITKSDFQKMRKTFDNYVIETPYKSGFYSGDRNVYASYNRTGYEYYPITDKRMWSNRVKAAPSAFSFPKVPDSIKVYPWPTNDNPWSSERVMGINLNIDTIEWDRMNARLGPSKRVNVIIVGFGSDTSLGEYQKSKWIGGKKNDLVLVVFTKNGKVFASDVFGWTESELVKSNLKTILLNNPIDNTLIPKIETEIRKNYIIKDWSKFDYLTVEPPKWSYFAYIGAMVVTQVVFWLWAHMNEFDKEGNRRYGYRYGRNSRRW